MKVVWTQTNMVCEYGVTMKAGVWAMLCKPRTPERARCATFAHPENLPANPWVSAFELQGCNINFLCLRPTLSHSQLVPHCDSPQPIQTEQPPESRESGRICLNVVCGLSPHQLDPEAHGQKPLEAGS